MRAPDELASSRESCTACPERAFELMARWLALGLLALSSVACSPSLAAGGRTSEPASQDALDAGYHEELEVSLVRWPLLVEPRGDAERCAGLSASHLRVSEGGEPADVRHVDLEPLPAVHALLLDLSYSMRDDVELVREAARVYFEGLTPGEEVALLSFGDEVRLLAGPTADRKRLSRALEDLEVGSNTALYDGVELALRLLAERRERKVLVILSDGVDTGSLPGRVAERAERLSAHVEGASVFPVVLRRRSTRDPRELLSLASLRTIADESGGLYTVVRHERGLPGAFRSIRERLAAEAQVSYRPPATAREVSLRGEAFVRVRVEASDDAPCRVSSAGPRRRALAAPRALRSRLEPRPAKEDARGAPESSAPGAPLFALWSSAGWGERDERPRELLGILQLEAAPGGLVEARGELVDLRLAPGAFFDRERSLRSGAPRDELGRRAGFARRPFRLLLPPLVALRAEGADPATLALRLVESIEEAPAPGSAPWPRPPLLVEGQAFLEHREAIGAFLWRARDDYRAFAAERLAALDRAFRAALVGAEPAEEELDAIVGGAKAAEPPDDVARVLAAWLGDVDAGELALELERRAEAARASGDEAARGRLEGARAQLEALFPLGYEARSLTPLLPSFEDSGERLGFYRIVLSYPDVEGRPRRLAPPAGMLGEVLAALRSRGLALSPDEILALELERIDAGRRPFLRLAGASRIRELEARYRLRVDSQGASDRALVVEVAAALDERGARYALACASRGQAPALEDLPACPGPERGED